MNEYEIQLSNNPNNPNDHSTRRYQTKAYSLAEAKAQASAQYPGWIIDWARKRTRH